jgi:hypothetical protein
MMGYAKYRIIKESVKFIDSCQKSALEGKISAECYRQLIGSKLIFLNEILKQEEGNLFVNSTLKSSVGRFN